MENCKAGRVYGYPYAVEKFLRQYQEKFRSRVDKYLFERLRASDGPAVPTLEDLQECIARAHADYLRDMEEHRNMPQPDLDAVQESLSDFRAGRWQPVQDVIDALPGGHS